MAKEKYFWKDGYRAKVEAEVAHSVLSDLRRASGKQTVTAQELLDASRAEDAPLHNCFEWDDSVAAEKFRLYQATKIIGSLMVTYIDDHPNQINTRFNINVVPKGQPGEYVTVEVALNTPAYRKKMLNDALRELQAFREKYHAYCELAEVFAAIDAYEVSTFVNG